MKIYGVVYQEPSEGAYPKGTFFSKKNAERFLAALKEKNKDDQWVANCYELTENEFDDERIEELLAALKRTEA